ncbi:hypothetical protein FSOLCH5_005890 [Fusarium solani]
MRPSEAPLAKPRTELNQVSAGKGALRARARAERCHKADPGMTTGSSSSIDEKNLMSAVYLYGVPAAAPPPPAPDDGWMCPPRRAPRDVRTAGVSMGKMSLQTTMPLPDSSI